VPGRRTDIFSPSVVYRLDHRLSLPCSAVSDSAPYTRLRLALQGGWTAARDAAKEERPSSMAANHVGTKKESSVRDKASVEMPAHGGDAATESKYGVTPSRGNGIGLIRNGKVG